MRSRVTFTGRFFLGAATAGDAAPTDCSMRPEYLVAAVDRAEGKKRSEGDSENGRGAGKGIGREREREKGCRVAGVALEIY